LTERGFPAVETGTALEGARALVAEVLAGSPTSVLVSLQVIDAGDLAGLAS
jgi:acetyl-CoA C-acetyltransferase